MLTEDVWRSGSACRLHTKTLRGFLTTADQQEQPFVQVEWSIADWIEWQRLAGNPDEFRNVIRTI